MIDVAFVTAQSTRDLDLESPSLIAHLKTLGLRAEQWAWDDDTVDWSQTRFAVVRSTWNYFLAVDDFLTWLNRVEGTTPMLNPAALIRWNADKHYLRDLEAAGVPVVPTHYVEPGESCDLEALIRRWGEVILKPTVSGGSLHTIRVAPSDVAVGTQHLAGLNDRAMMVQPMMPNILKQGERSQLYFAGELSHVVDKRPAVGDFRVQEHLGGLYQRAEPRARDLELAQAALAALPIAPLYARVDCVDDAQGQPLLMEIELIEPDLYLRHAPGSEARFCRALAARASLG